MNWQDLTKRVCESLLRAAREGEEKKVFLAIEEGADVNYQDSVRVCFECWKFMWMWGFMSEYLSVCVCINGFESESVFGCERVCL